MGNSCLGLRSEEHEQFVSQMSHCLRPSVYWALTLQNTSTGGGQVNSGISRRQFDLTVTSCPGHTAPLLAWPPLWLSLSISRLPSAQRITPAKRNEKRYCGLLNASGVRACLCFSACTVQLCSHCGFGMQHWSKKHGTYFNQRAEMYPVQSIGVLLRFMCGSVYFSESL